jgi:hypothetical protein
MHVIHLQFGFPTVDLEYVRSLLEKAFAIEMEPHDSMYWGEYYLWKPTDGDELMLYYNLDPLFEPRINPPSEQYFEPEYPHLGILLDADLTKATYERIGSTLFSLEKVQHFRLETY